MKILKIVLMLALLLGVASVFAGAVSAADQTNNPLIVKEESVHSGAASQTTGKIESGNVSKIDLNEATKPETTVNVENSTISELANDDVTDIVPVQSVDNSTEAGKEADLTDLQSGNSRELTIEEMKSIKGQGIGDEISKWGRYAWDQLSAAGRYITDNFGVYKKRGDVNLTRIQNSSGNYTYLNGNIYFP